MKVPPEQREELRRLNEAATPGPWGHNAHGTVARIERHMDDWSDSVACRCESQDADLIAAMRNALPALLDVIEEADREVERLREGMQVQIERYERLYKHTGKDTHKATACTLRRLLNDTAGQTAGGE